MAILELKDQIARLPEQPGVYLFLGAGGDTLVRRQGARPCATGCARIWAPRASVRASTRSCATRPRLEVIVTDSVVEALALENRLIKQRNPRFNVLLRDDKTYPYLQLTTTERAPRLLVARQVARDGNVYAGPFMPASVARRTMTLAHRLFGIRSCNEIIDGKRERPCLEYDIKRCVAPCVESICTIEEYGHAVEQARLLIEGRQDELVSGLEDEMQEAAAREAFERAAHLRDAIKTIETLTAWRNKMEAPATGDRDVFGLKAGASGGVVEVFQMRGGRIADRVELVTERSGEGNAALDAGDLGDAGLLSIALQQFYADRLAPSEVHTPVDARADEVGRGRRLAVRTRGPARPARDAEAWRQARPARPGGAQCRHGLPVPLRRRCDDGVRRPRHAARRCLRCRRCHGESNASTSRRFQGRETVASMVVAVEGRMKKGEYRKFRIKGTYRSTDPSIHRSIDGSRRRWLDGPLAVVADDFASMREVVVRRYQRVLAHGGPFPDLIVIDGGKGQLSAAYEGLREVGLERLVAIGLAKEEELIFTRDREDGIALPRESSALRLLQRVRDEAHRFAVTFHRQSRAKRDFSSELDQIVGVGARRRKQLLTAFGSVAGVRRASRAELAAVVGPKAADAVLRHFAT